MTLGANLLRDGAKIRDVTGQWATRDESGGRDGGEPSGPGRPGAANREAQQ